MRVIAGKFKGRVLKSFDEGHIRPTTDRVKETLFNILQNEIVEARVLDLFSGTGNLSIEAFSRGARHVESVEKHPGSLKVIQSNLKLLGIEKEIYLHREDAFKFIANYHGEPFDIILVDPPFTESLAHSLLEAISTSAIFHEQSLIAIESAKKERLDEDYGSLGIIDRRKFGDKILTFFSKKSKEKAL